MLKKVAKDLKNKVNSLVYNSRRYQKVIDGFHELYYNSERWKLTKWEGIETQKCPLDMWIYQEIINEVKPDFIIETGTRYGGSALYIARLLDALGKGKIITIDTVKENFPRHEKITYVNSSSTNSGLLEKIKRIIKPEDQVLVILDSDHSKEHVLKEMNLYSNLVTKGSYMIVEDSNVNGHPVHKNHGEGPMEAIQEFLKKRTDFKIDKTKEKLFLTFNPNGYLKKIK